MWKQYRRTGLSEMRPYLLGENLDDVSVNKEDNPEQVRQNLEISGNTLKSKVPEGWGQIFLYLQDRRKWEYKKK